MSTARVIDIVVIYIFAAILILSLARLSWIDYKTYRLPDILTLPLIAIGGVQAWALNMNVYASLIGAAAGYLSFIMIELSYKRLRGKNGLGRGDAKLLAAAGAWCGWAGLPVIVLIASGSGLVMLLLPSFRQLSDEGRIPFGPFLAFGFLVVWAAQHAALTGLASG